MHCKLVQWRFLYSSVFFTYPQKTNQPTSNLLPQFLKGIHNQVDDPISPKRSKFQKEVLKGTSSNNQK